MRMTLLALIALFGCSSPGQATLGAECTTTTDCSAGLFCVTGACARVADDQGPPPPPEITVVVTPATIDNLRPLQMQTFTAQVANAADTNVAWSVLEGPTGGSIDSSGVYRAPSTVGIYHVRATSTADVSRFADATVNVTAFQASLVAGALGGDGWADGQGDNARFRYLTALDVDSSGTIWVVDAGNGVVKRVSPSGQVTTVAGNREAYVVGSTGQTAPLGPGTQAVLADPRGIVVGGDGSVYVTQGGFAGDDQYKVLRVDPVSTAVTDFAGGVYGDEDNANGLNAKFNYPYRLASDGSSLLMTDVDTQKIRRISLTGSRAVTTFAGNGTGIDDGYAAIACLSASFGSQAGLTVRGSLSGTYEVDVVEPFYSRIRRITGNASTCSAAGFAGASDGAPGYADGATTAARFNSPESIKRAGTSGYVADTGNHAIRHVSPAGQVTTLAGAKPPTAVAGYADGPSGVARFSSPHDIGVSPDGSAIYVIDNQPVIRRVDAITGSTTTLAGKAPPTTAGDCDDCPIANARFPSLSDVTHTSSGDLLVLDREAKRIRRLSFATGLVTSVATLAEVAHPHRVIEAANGDLIVSDLSSQVHRYSSAGILAESLGSGLPGLTDSPPTFKGPAGMALGPSGEVYVADRGNSAIRKIVFSASGGSAVVTTVAGSGSDGAVNDVNPLFANFRMPDDVLVHAGVVYVSDRGNCVIRAIGAGGVTTLAGVAGECSLRDGAATQARFSDLGQLALGPEQALFVTDADVVRRIDLTGAPRVTTPIGSSLVGGTVVLAPAAAVLNAPSCLAFLGATPYVCSERAVLRIQ